MQLSGIAYRDFPLLIKGITLLLSKSVLLPLSSILCKTPINPLGRPNNNIHYVGGIPNIIAKLPLS
jgi:hypothetical protein